MKYRIAKRSIARLLFLRSYKRRLSWVNAVLKACPLIARTGFYLLPVLGCIICAVPFTDGSSVSAAEPAAWVDHTSKKLTLDEKIGQLIQLRAYGDYFNFGDPLYQQLIHDIHKYHPGSLVLAGRMVGPNLSKGTPEQVAAILNHLQRESDLPLLVASDFERGLASRVSRTPEFPFPMAFAASNDPSLVTRFGEVSAKQSRMIGIHWSLAPTADVNSNSANPIINTRSFGEDPKQVGEYVKAYIEGAHHGHLLVTAKHFPGHGDSSTDSHVGIVRIDSNRDHLRQVELPPFRAAIAAEVDAIMPAHASVPAFDLDPLRIATTSPKILTGLLKQQFGFKGLIVTDALEMRGLTNLYPAVRNPTGRAAVDAIKAGADVLMVLNISPQAVGEIFDSIRSAVKNGEISETRIDESVRKILTVKEKLGLDRLRFVDESMVKSTFDQKESFAFAQQVSDKSITLLRNNGNILPLNGVCPRPTSKPQELVVITSSDSKNSPLGREFERQFALRSPDARIYRIYNDGIGSAEPSEVLAAVKAAHRVVIAAYVTHVPGRQLVSGGRMVVPVGMMGESAKLLSDVIHIHPKETVVIALGTPYLIQSFPEIENYICTYSLASTAEVSTVRALFGEIQNRAKLPITIPGVASRGFSIPWPSAPTRDPKF